MCWIYETIGVSNYLLQIHAFRANQLLWIDMASKA